MTDFLSQVQEAEQKAATLLEKAVTRNQGVLRKYKTELAEAQKEKENVAQEEMKSSIQSARANARQSYETQVHAGEDEARKLETERGTSIKATLPEAMNFFLELL
jgi:vacuolar-type H+-ATPase subunit H